MQRRPLSIVNAAGMMQLLALLLPMLPGVVAAQWLQLYRPWFWAEFLMLVALTRGRPWLFALGLALLWSADFLFIFAQINLSSSYSDVLDLLSYIPHTNVTWIMAGIAGLLVLSLWGALCVQVYKRASPGHGMLLWVVALLGLALLWPARNGFEHSEGKIYGVRTTKLAGSWVLDSQFLRDTFSFYEEGYADDLGKFVKLGADRSAVKKALGNDVLPDKLLVIVVESWGLARDEAENQFWQNLWNSPAWAHEGGKLEFMGATLQGEFRELCGLFPHTLRIEVVPQANDCLPHQLKRQGWQTQAFHGASSKMYRRDQWYPEIGFEHSYFMQQLMPGSSMCANIPGVCDYSIASRVVDSLRRNGKQFTYWMTLNSHTPYRDSDLSNPKVKDQVCPFLKLNGARCAHAALLYDFMHVLKTQLQHVPIPGLQVVLVGDHSPKFFDAQSREQFDETAVPYVSIRVPRQSATEPSAD